MSKSKRTPEQQTVKRDDSKINPGLHALYIKTAITHLLAIDKAIIDFHQYSNLNMNGPILALYKERAILTKENAAYSEAQEILESLASRKLLSRRGDCFLGYHGENE